MRKKTDKKSASGFEEKVVGMMKTFLKGAEYAKEFSRPEPKTFFMTAPQTTVTRQDLEEVLAVRKSKKAVKDPTILVFERKTSTLFIKGKPETTLSLAGAPLRKKVLAEIRLEFITTAELANRLNTTTKSIQEAVGKINREAMNKLSLKQKLILGKERAGYQLNPLYSLIKK